MADNQIVNELASKAKSGDNQAFGELFEALSDQVYRFLKFRVKDPADAEDLLSQVFIDAWQSLPRFNTDQPFRPWLFSIARYKLIDFYRRNRRRILPLEAVTEMAGTTDLQVEAELESDLEQVRSAISKLPETYQTVLQLKFIEELEYEEIAPIMGRPVGHLRVLVNRGLKYLKRYL